jgi:hypothetical protein
MSLLTDIWAKLDLILWEYVSTVTKPYKTSSKSQQPKVVFKAAFYKGFMLISLVHNI